MTPDIAKTVVVIAYVSLFALSFAIKVQSLPVLVAMLVLIAFRLGPEERMLLEEFGEEYEAYRKRSKRLIPGVW